MFKGLVLAFVLINFSYAIADSGSRGPSGTLLDRIPPEIREKLLEKFGDESRDLLPGNGAQHSRTFTISNRVDAWWGSYVDEERKVDCRRDPSRLQQAIDQTSGNFVFLVSGDCEISKVNWITNRAILITSSVSIHDLSTRTEDIPTIQFASSECNYLNVGPQGTLVFDGIIFEGAGPNSSDLCMQSNTGRLTIIDSVIRGPNGSKSNLFLGGTTNAQIRLIESSPYFRGQYCQGNLCGPFAETETQTYMTSLARQSTYEISLDINSSSRSFSTNHDLAMVARNGSVAWHSDSAALFNGFDTHSKIRFSLDGGSIASGIWVGQAVEITARRQSLGVPDSVILSDVDFTGDESSSYLP